MSYELFQHINFCKKKHLKMKDGDEFYSKKKTIFVTEKKTLFVTVAAKNFGQIFKKFVLGRELHKNETFGICCTPMGDFQKNRPKSSG